MALAHRCDRCGKYYDDNDIRKQGDVSVDDSVVVGIAYVHWNTIDRRLDLCDSCVKKLKDFMAMREE